ncbi:MAG TPA: peroxiredoxin [Candidatus Saccharimonadales bacterium]|nr:peroxiredoxin [Candidatus Saccharimonadales bacterium]
MEGRTTSQGLEVGSPAPDFELPATNGETVRLSDYRGRKHVMLVFYPLDWSPVCSNQLPALEGEKQRFEALDTQILGISVDSRWSHDAFARSLGLSFPLLADIHRTVLSQYGMLREKDNISERAMVIVDKKGILRYRHVFDIGKVPSHDEALRVLQSLS